MSKHLLVTQLIEESNVSNNFINKLYNMCYRDSTGQDIFDDTSNFIGTIQTGYTYKEYIDLIREYFPLLHISPDGYFVLFEDKIVEQILINNFSDDPNGVKTSLNVSVNDGFYKQGIGQVFKQNTQITRFNELSQLENVKRIGGSSFYACENLETIDLSNITVIKEAAFQRCSSLAIDIYCPNLITLEQNVFNISGVTSVSSLGTITVLPNRTFYDCASLTEVRNNALNLITEIQYWAFRNCERLTTVGNTSNLRIIGNMVFANCSSLTSFDFSTITQIGDQAFQNCSALIVNDLSIPNLISLGNTVFQNDILIKSISNLGSITSIQYNTFYKCTGLTYINPDIFSNCTLIGSYAFADCTSLIIDDLNAPNLITIGQYAFCKVPIKKVTNLGSIANIPQNAFNNTAMSSINIPETVTTISAGALANNANLTTINVDWSKITSIENNILSGCPLLGDGQTIELNLTSQTRYPQHATYGTAYKRLIVHMNIANMSIDYRYPIHEAMSKLEYLDISDTTVDKWGDTYGCGRLKTAILPASITYLEYRMTHNLPLLEHFIILVEDPTTITTYPAGDGSSKFNGNDGGNANIYVKDETAKSKYLAHYWWGAIVNASTRIKTLSELPTGVWTTGLYQQYEPYLSNH